MNCLNHHPPSLPLGSKLRHQNREFWRYPGISLASRNSHWNSKSNLSRKRFEVKANAFRDPFIILRAIPPSQSGNITTFLGISAGLLFLYWVGNFVVPDLITKDLMSNNPDEDEDSDNI